MTASERLIERMKIALARTKNGISARMIPMYLSMRAFSAAAGAMGRHGAPVREKAIAAGRRLVTRRDAGAVLGSRGRFTAMPLAGALDRLSRVSGRFCEYLNQGRHPMALKAMCAALLLAGVFAGDAAAQDYPNRPITVIVPFAAGGPADLLARILGAEMSGTAQAADDRRQRQRRRRHHRDGASGERPRPTATRFS